MLGLMSTWYFGSAVRRSCVLDKRTKGRDTIRAEKVGCRGRRVVVAASTQRCPWQIGWDRGGTLDRRIRLDITKDNEHKEDKDRMKTNMCLEQSDQYLKIV